MRLISAGHLLCVFLSLIVVEPSVVASQSNESIIEDDAFFYGQSPPVYPSPQTSGLGSWSAAYAKAVKLVSQMTLEERANIAVGYPLTTQCSGETGTVPRLNWPGICMSGAGNGIRKTDFVNSWPSGMHVGASWNRNLTYQRAVQMGGEFRKKGSHVAGGPVVGPLGRQPRGGRSWEGFSNDPYLAGQLAATTVEGIQEQGVSAMIKHLVGYEQQNYRLPNKTTNTSAVSSNIDDRTMHEMYLWPFVDAIHAGCGVVMCSYNRLNNSYACQNSKVLNGLLKSELGFQGWVISDWGAQLTGIASAEAGLDVAMPTSVYWGESGGNLTAAVQNSSLAESRLTDMAMRVVTTWYQMNQDSGFPQRGIGMPANFTTYHKPVYARDPASKPILLNGAIEGHVLVKNVNNSLPLKSPKLLSVFGYDAPAPRVANVPDPVLDVEGNGWILGSTSLMNPSVIYEAILGYIKELPQYAIGGTIIVGGGSGANAPAYISAPFDAIQEQAYHDDTSLFWDFESTNPTVDADSDACLVFINAFATEGVDRTGIHDDYSDDLILNVAANCTNTIVIIHNAGIRLVDQWISHPNITAVIFAHLPGQDSGRALTKILYGEVSPSAKLPYTVAKNESDYMPVNPAAPEGKYKFFPQSDFTEGIYLDYRHFDAQNITPRYEFGFGLSYTTFSYSDLTVNRLSNASQISELPPKLPTVPGGNPALWETLIRVTAQVTNTGSVAAAEVAQLYINVPGDDTPVRMLRGFDKQEVPVGGSVDMSFELTRRDLSVWNVTEQDWVLRRGEYKFFVGASSRNLPLQQSLVI